MDEIIENFSLKNAESNLISDTFELPKKKQKTEPIKDLNNIANPIWLSVSEAAKISGVNQKTIRRAIQNKQINYKIYKDRYLINLSAIIQYMYSNKKLKNKYIQYGLGQYF